MKTPGTTPSSFEGKDITRREIAEAFELSKEAFGDSGNFARYIEQELRVISSVLESELGGVYLGGFGLGYPFYARHQEKFFKVQEVDDFISKGVQDIRQNKDGSTEWLCPSCQEENNLPDLKTVCKDCPLVGEEIKPIKVLATLPDLDMLIVTKDNQPTTLGKIEQILRTNGYQQFDLSIGSSFRRAKRVLKDLKDGKEPSEKFPVDVHVLSYDQFVDISTRIASGEKTRIVCPALHTTWEDHDLQIWFDFVFSMQEIYVAPELKTVVTDTRKKLKQHWGEDALVDAIKNYYPRIQRIFQTLEVEAALREKIRQW